MSYRSPPASSVPGHEHGAPIPAVETQKHSYHRSLPSVSRGLHMQPPTPSQSYTTPSPSLVFGPGATLNGNSSFQPKVPAEAPSWPSQTPSRRQPNAEEWESWRPLIKHLYIDENYTFEQVATVLRQQCNFEPTKRQFKSRTTKWGLKKNTTRSQRASILENLAGSLIGASRDGEGTVLVNRDKLSRWKKSDAAVFHAGPSAEPQQVGSRKATPSKTTFPSISPRIKSESCERPLSSVISDTPSLFDDDSHVSSSSPNSAIAIPDIAEFVKSPSMPIESLASAMTMDPEHRSLWDAARIMDSPRLTTLFEAIKIDEEIPLLSATDSVIPVKAESKDLPSTISLSDILNNTDDCWDSDDAMTVSSRHSSPFSGYGQSPSVSPTSSVSPFNRSLDGDVLGTWTPLFELSPFPTYNKMSAYQSNFTLSVDLSRSSLKQAIKQSRARLRTLESTLLPNSVGVLSEVQALASLLDQYGKYKQSEVLYHRIIMAKQKLFETYHPDAIGVYFNFINTKIHQTRLSEAEEIHEAIHSQILGLFGSNTQFGMTSTRIMATIKRCLHKFEAAEALDRQGLQVALNQFGIKHPTTTRFMHTLAITMLNKNSAEYERRGVLQSCEQLVRHAIAINGRTVSKKNYFKTNEFNTLGSILGELGLYEESTELAHSIVKTYWEDLGLESKKTLDSLFYYGKGLRLEGDLDRAECVQRFSVRMQLEFLGMDYIYNVCVLEELGFVLEKLGFWEEALLRYEDAYRYNMSATQPDKKIAKERKNDMRKCCTMQGLYKDEAEFERYVQMTRDRKVMTTAHLERGRKWCRFERDENSAETLSPKWKKIRTK